MIIQELIAQGFTEKEAELYLVLIRYGANRAGDICKLVNMNRTLVYALLENLIKKGYIEKVSRNGKMFYIAHDPELFRHRAKIQLHQTDSLLEHLRNIQLTKSQPIIRTFRGLSGIQQMTELFLEEAKTGNGEMLQLGQEIRFVLEYPNLIEDFIGKRTRRNIHLKLICNEFDGFKKYLNASRDPHEFREVKFVPKKELDVDCTTYIYGDSMAVISLAEEMQGYIMKSKNVTDMYRKMFFLLWSRI